MKKYELGRMAHNGLRGIIALRDFSDVKAGDLGGYISNEFNLSHYGDCWVYDNSEISGLAIVYGDTKIKDSSFVFDDAYVHGNTVISSCHIHSKCEISGNTILDKTTVSGPCLIENFVCSKLHLRYGTLRGDISILDQYKFKCAVSLDSLSKFVSEIDFLCLGDTFYFRSEEDMFRHKINSLQIK